MADGLAVESSTRDVLRAHVSTGETNMSNYRNTGGALKLRKHAGKYLQSCRKQAGLTQVEAAEAMGQKYFTFVSQLEQGRHRLAPEQWSFMANLYGQPVDRFAMTLLAFYDPHVYQCIFGDQPPPGQATMTARGML